MNDHQRKLYEYGRLLTELESEDYRYRLVDFVETLNGERFEIPLNLRKLKECRGCGRIFYDVSRNGRMSFCHWIPYARHNYARGASMSNLTAGETVKSFCQMRADAERKRRLFNVDRHGVNYDGYRISGFYEDYEFAPGDY